MGFQFNANDVFVMAEQMERNGAKFYRSAAEGISESGNKKLLVELANMEDQHQKVFMSLREELSEKHREKTIFDPADESVLYLNALADTRVFFEKEIDTSSLEGIYKAAIEAEKDSIVFYLGMKEAVPENLGKSKLENIIKEEMKHVRMLSNELSSLKK